MSSVLRRNMIFNYVAQFYAIAIGIIVLPMTLSFTSAEAYGLIGVYTLIQTVLYGLDAGLSQTMSREVAKYKSLKQDEHKLRLIANSIEAVFLIMALFASVSLYFSSEFIAESWLDYSLLTNDQVISSFQVIALIVGLRWFVSASRSGLNGYERQAWLSTAEIVINTLRFPLSLAVLYIYEGSIGAYFGYQLLVAVFELVVLRAKFRSLLPKVRLIQWVSLTELRYMLPLSLSIAYSTATWTIATQSDKLYFSKTLMLNEFGFFILVATLAGGLLQFSGPITKALTPRLVKLFHDGDKDRAVEMYRLCTRITVLALMPIAAVIAFNSEQTVYVWTGNAEAAIWAKDILPLYILTAAVMGVFTMQYLLQLAHGNLQLQNRYNTVTNLITVAAVFMAGSNGGVVGVAWSLFAIRVMSLLFWLPWVQKKIVPELAGAWITDIGASIAIVVSVVYFISTIITQETISDRFGSFVHLGALYGISLSLSLIFVFMKEARHKFFGK